MVLWAGGVNEKCSLVKISEVSNGLHSNHRNAATKHIRRAFIHKS